MKWFLKNWCFGKHMMVSFSGTTIFICTKHFKALLRMIYDTQVEATTIIETY